MWMRHFQTAKFFRCSWTFCRTEATVMLELLKSKILPSAQNMAREHIYNGLLNEHCKIQIC